MGQQLNLFGDTFILPERPVGPALTEQDELPPGPFALSMMWDDDCHQYCRPFSVIAANGKTVAGHCPSVKIAAAIRDALNQLHPAPEPETATNGAEP